MRIALALAALLFALPAQAAPSPGKAEPARKLAPLIGASPAEVRAALGEPAVANEEGKGGLWTYRLEACALMVFFKDEGAGLRVSSVSAGPRKRGDPTPEVERCMAGAKR